MFFVGIYGSNVAFIYFSMLEKVEMGEKSNSHNTIIEKKKYDLQAVGGECFLKKE